MPSVTLTSPGNITLEKIAGYTTTVAASDSFRIMSLKLTASNADLTVTRVEGGRPAVPGKIRLRTVQLYFDKVNQGTLDIPGDSLVAEQKYSADNGSVTLDLDSLVVTSASPRYFILAYRYNAYAVSGRTFIASIAK